MKKLIIASAITAAFAGHAAYAEEAAAPAATPDNVVTYNVGLASEYRYRGISQSQKDPALSAGADYTHNPTGLYLGTWASNIKWITDTGGDAEFEIDVYGGKRGEIAAGATYDVGFINYNYPNNNYRSVGFPSANTVEVYGQAGYDVFTLKYSHALSDWVGFANSRNSHYFDLSANPELYGGYVLNLHAGRQIVKGNDANYTDWKVGVTKDYGIAVAAVAVVGTTAINEDTYKFGPKFIGRTGVFASLTKNF